jgi:hypothetical protein
MLVMIVATAKTQFEKQVLLVGTKQNRQADKAVRPAYFLCPLLALLFFEVDAIPNNFFSHLLLLDIYGFYIVE